MSTRPPDSAEYSSAPDVGRLLSAVLPLSGLSACAGGLVSAWGRTLDLEVCCLLWRDDRCGVVRGMIWRPGEPEQSLELNPEDELSLEATVLCARDPLPTDLAWDSLPDVEHEPVMIGLSPRSARRRVQDSWKAATTQLWRAARDFEERLWTEKLAALAEFAAGAGHEINNPLGSIIGRASLLLKDEVTPSQRRHVETIGAQAYRIRDMIGDVMLFARPPHPQIQEFDLWEVARKVASRYQERAAQQNIELHAQLSGKAPVLADPDQLATVISELVRNAVEAVSADGWVRLEGGTALSERAWYVLDVVDSGPGFSPEQRRHCFDPFYSGRSAGRGLGFGLPKCWQIVHQHGGTIWLSPAPEETRFRVRLLAVPLRD